MADAVAGEIRQIIEAAVLARGHVLLALPGGKTPLGIIARLVQMPLDWAAITIIPGDDRLVAADDPLSNYGMLERALGASGARIVPLVTQGLEYHASARDASARLASLPWPPDLVWLGMGSDGHTASIFPGPDLEAALAPPADALALGVLPDPLPPEAPVARVTLTKPAILSARALILTISGAEKRAVLERALAQGVSSPYPVGRVLGDAQSPLMIHWCP